VITAKTCLILGAGASAPYGFPTAAALRKLILSMEVPNAGETCLNFPVIGPDGSIRDRRIEATLAAEKRPLRSEVDWRTFLDSVCKKTGCEDDALSGFRTTFFSARRTNIDKFIQRYEEDYGLVGRIQLAATILNCERDRWLDGDWYSQLFEEVVPNGPEDLQENRLSVITFNYDRSFEQFFTTGFQHSFRLTNEKASAVFGRIQVTHVYGTLGTLGNMPYGKLEYVRDAAQRISFIRDARRPACKSELEKAVEGASNVCFIGFGFAAENVELFDASWFANKRLLATSRGLSPNRMSQVKKKLKHVEFVEGTAFDLLNSYNIFESKRTAAKVKQLPVRRTRSNFVRSAMTDPSNPWMDGLR
jgi:hypothetical protein